MADMLVAGAVLSASAQRLFNWMTSQGFLDVIQGKLTVELLEKLQNSLSSAKSTLNVAERNPIRDLNAKKWLDDLKEAIYKADDLIAEIESEALRCKLEEDQPGGITSLVKNLIPTSSTTIMTRLLQPKLIKTILDSLESVVKQKDHFLNNENVAATRLPTNVFVQSSIYGRDSDKEDIIRFLRSNNVSNKKLTVVPLVGMFGIGKTTLAQLVFNDDRVKEHFTNLTVWVNVSDEFDIFKLTKTILEGVTSKTCDVQDQNQVQELLKEALTGKKFLFVLDDVWNEKYVLWDALKSSFVFASNGSAIILTTRNENVASLTCTSTSPIRYVQKISDEKSWLLFKDHAFDIIDSSEHQNLEVIGRKIAKKYTGLPFAIKSIGGLLRSESRIVEWENILKSEIWELPERVSNILQTVWSSYHHLPPHLKRCFSYCSIFPKDYEFEKEELILFWMAEGFLQPQGSRRMEDIGEEYFHELMSNSLIQKSSLKEQLFTMHDLVNDLATFASGEFCFKLLDNDTHVPTIKTRHFSYMGGKTFEFKKVEVLSKAKHLRTLLLFGGFLEKEKVSWKFILSKLLPKLKCLRVLVLSGYSFTNLRNSIDELKHLRYLDLSWSHIKKLPSTICTLYNLQTLRLSNCRNLTRLPSNMGNLIYLRHLDISGTSFKGMPLRLGNLKDLQTLSDFVLGKDSKFSSIKEIRELQHLHGKLCISSLENIVNVNDASEANLKDKQYLTELSFRWDTHANDAQQESEVLEKIQPHTGLKKLLIHSYKGTRFPNWVGCHLFSQMVSVHLTNCGNCNLLPPLGQLLSLKELEIRGFDGVVTIGDEFYSSGSSNIMPFRSLECLTFQDMSEWEQWSLHQGNTLEAREVFPHLKRLHLKNCPKLAGNLPDVKESLEIKQCKELEFPRNNLYLSLTSLNIDESCDSMRLFSLDDFPNLASLSLEGCQNLESLPYGNNVVPCLKKLVLVDCPKLKVNFGENFASLSTLRISECQEQELFPEGRCLPNLKEIHIFNCEKLISKIIELDLQRFTSLRSLALIGYENELDLFPNEGLLPMTLASIHLASFQKLKALKGIAFQQLTSLEKLEFKSCNELNCLTEEGLPSSVSYLSIDDCPFLEQRYNKRTGEDWPKIAHIPRVSIL